jgi:hypothetical protein
MHHTRFVALLLFLLVAFAQTPSPAPAPRSLSATSPLPVQYEFVDRYKAILTEAECEALDAHLGADPEAAQPRV